MNDEYVKCKKKWIVNKSMKQFIRRIKKIQIRFKSQLEDGELFQFEDEMEQFRAFIRKHFLLVEVKLNERSSVLISSSNVSDGTWHKVVIEKSVSIFIYLFI